MARALFRRDFFARGSSCRQSRRIYQKAIRLIDRLVGLMFGSVRVWRGSRTARDNLFCFDPRLMDEIIILIIRAFLRPRRDAIKRRYVRSPIKYARCTRD